MKKIELNLTGKPLGEASETLLGANQIGRAHV